MLLLGKFACGHLQPFAKDHQFAPVRCLVLTICTSGGKSSPPPSCLRCWKGHQRGKQPGNIIAPDSLAWGNRGHNGRSEMWRPELTRWKQGPQTKPYNAMQPMTAITTQQQHTQDMTTFQTKQQAIQGMIQEMEDSRNCQPLITGHSTGTVWFKGRRSQSPGVRRATIDGSTQKLWETLHLNCLGFFGAGVAIVALQTFKRRSFTRTWAPVTVGGGKC